MGQITYDPTKNLITVIGYKDETNKIPWTPEDIYQASETNGWGVVDKLSEGRGYKINAYLQIGDAMTETMLQIYREFVQVGDENDYLCVWLRDNAILQLGDLENYKLESGIYGGMLLLYQDYNRDIVDVGAYNYWTGTLKLYGAKIVRLTTQSGFISLALAGELDFRDSGLLSNQRWYFSPNARGSVKRTYFHCDDRYLYIYTENVSWRDIRLSAKTTILVSGKDTTIRNTDFSNLGTYYVNYKATVKLYDCILPSFDILRGGSEGGKFYIYYTLKVKVTTVEGVPIEGALVQVFDKDGNKVAEGTTGADGYAPPFELLVHYKEYAGPDQLVADIDYNPFIVSVWKEGYEQFWLKITIAKPMEMVAILTRTGIRFGPLAFANRYEEGEKVLLAIPLYMADGTPITDGVVSFKIVKPDGTVVQDWTQAQHLGEGVYVAEIVGMTKGMYIVMYRGEYQGMKTFGADTVQIVRDKTEIVREIKRNRSIVLGLLA